MVLDRSEEAVWKSFRNLGERVQIILTDELNAYDVLVNDSIVFSQRDVDRAGRAVRRVVEVTSRSRSKRRRCDEADGGAQ